MTPTTDLLKLAARTRLLVLDVDGVLTDGLLHYGTAGEETKSFHVRDGAGIKALLRAGMAVAIISGRNSPATTIRMQELGLKHVRQGCEDKLAALQELLRETGFGPAQVACVGDDAADLSMMRTVGLAIAVADAHPTARDAAHWVTRLPGGFGAVREVCDLLLDAREPKN
jgi:3-deoxy-D-manno-octulosonate 8-phosphate phosphatase (KDO 8-P phosphatase)